MKIGFDIDGVLVNDINTANLDGTGIQDMLKIRTLAEPTFPLLS